MKKRTALEPLSMLAILAPGAVGMFVVARTLAAYFPRDLTASLVVGAMAVVLLLGLLELIVRNRRAAALEAEVSALPVEPNEATLASASPLLGSYLRARLENAATPGLGESTAPFLTGLLVMLGLLGTLFGLFETVLGASHALTASADLSALRASLSTPISGLTRSFGCSAAGISASAMLGLAVALVRRREGRALRAVHAYSVGPLRALAPLRAQTAAIRELADQGLALPQAAHALERVGKDLAALSAQLVTVQSAGVEAQKRAFQELVGELRAELSAVAREVGASVHAAAAPALEGLSGKLLESAETQGAALARLASELSAQLEADARARANHGSELVQKLAGAVERLERQGESDAAARRAEAERELGALAEAARALTESAERDAGARRAEAERELAGLGEAARTIAEQLRESAGEQRRAAAEQLAKLAAVAGDLEQQFERAAATRGAESEALIERLGARFEEIESARASARAAELERLSELATRALREAEAREAAHESRLAELAARSEQSAARAEERDADRLTKLDALTARVGGDLERVRDALERRLSGERDEALEFEERVQRALFALTENARAFEQTVVAQRGAIEQLVSGLPPLFSEVAAATQRGAEAALAELTTHSAERLDRIAESLEAEQALRLESARAHEQQTTATVERLRESADLLERNLEQQRGVIDGLAERVGGLLEQLIASTRQSAEHTLARLSDSAEEQAMRWAKLESELAEGRLEHARSLEEQLANHASGLESKLAQAATVVHDAASLWKASSAEMQAIVDAFAKSVERQREASDAWLESLGDIEASVERSGRHAAADALADQLSSTQEVFARQLQFQRELFEQLRSLRSVSRVGAVEHEVGGSDVSV